MSQPEMTPTPWGHANYPSIHLLFRWFQEQTPEAQEWMVGNWVRMAEVGITCAQQHGQMVEDRELHHIVDGWFA
jgi:hypothetical protein